MSAYLIILIIIAFPLLYYGGQKADAIMSVIGIILMLSGMSVPIIKRITVKNNGSAYVVLKSNTSNENCENK